MSLRRDRQTWASRETARLHYNRPRRSAGVLAGRVESPGNFSLAGLSMAHGGGRGVQLGYLAG